MRPTLWRAVRRHPRRSAAALTLAAGCALAMWLRLGPIADGLLALPANNSTMVVDRRGVPLYEALSSDGVRSSWLDASHLPPRLVAATLAAEDRRFWSHPGVDVVALLRAAKHNLAERQIVEGGSTITQQTAKLLLNRRSPGRRRGFAEKIEEAVLALRLEHRFDKREILALYLNLAAYGNQIAGAQRASQAYFGCDAAMLTAAQAAFLAGLPQRPSGFNPYRHESAARMRQRTVLKRMAAAGALTQRELDEALAEKLAFPRTSTPFLAPHFVARVLAGARAACIETTLDAELQADIAGIIRSQRRLLDRHGAANVAVVVLDNASGSWLAWEGSGDYFDADHGGAIDGVATARQPGSALKPFTYALAFEEGFTPATALADVPSHFPTAEPGVLYSPRNYDGKYRGPLLARRALAGSENVPAVALASELGVPKLLRFLLRAGLSTFDRNASYYGLGVTLGDAEVRLDELVAAYSAFARGGEWLAPTWLREPGVRERHALVSPRTAFWISDVLSDADAREFIFGRGGNLEFPFPVAAKTGTSQAYHDNWTIGYTRRVTVGVWVGNFDRTPLRDSTGVTGAGPIFHAVMLAAERRAGTFIPGDGSLAQPTPDLERRDICALSGMPANRWCPARQREWLPSAAGSDPPCRWHYASADGVVVTWPPEYRVWAGALGSDEGQTRVRRGSDEGQTSVRPASDPRLTPWQKLTIAYPPDGATYSIDPTLRRDFQTLTLRAVSGAGDGLEWSVDGRILGTAASEQALTWPLAPGNHRISVADRAGNRAVSTIVVK
jgi:penicillin-binding protein 1C